MDQLSTKLNRWLQWVSMIVLVALMLLTVTDVAGRWLLGQPVQGTVEVTQLAMVAIVFLALGRVEHHDEHIAIDIVVTRLPQRWQRAVRILVGLVSFLLLLAISWQLYEFAGRLRVGNYATGVLQIPTYPVALLAVAGALAYTLAILNNVVILIRGSTPEDQHDAS